MDNPLLLLAKWSTRIKNDSFSQQSYDLAKIALIDSLSHSIYGSQTETTEVLLKNASLWGAGNGTIWGRKESFSPAVCALINGATSNAEDCSAYDNLSLSHSPSSVYAALIACAENLEQNTQTATSGKQLLNAFVVGMEGLLFVSQALNPSHYYSGWHTSATVNAIGATLACCHLLTLNEKQTATALSLSTSRLAGYKSQFGSMAKILHAGFAAESGVICAYLAQQGANANFDTFTGPYSLETLHGGKNPPGFTKAKLSDYRQKNCQSLLEKTGLFYKPYPTCAFIHPLAQVIISVSESLSKEDKENIKQVIIQMPTGQYQSIANTMPTNEYQARFSLNFCMAHCLLLANLKSEYFMQKYIDTVMQQNSTIYQLMQKIKVLTHKREKSTYEIIFSHPRSSIKGETQTMKDWDKEIFFEVFQYKSKNILSKESISKCLDVLKNIEQLNQISQLLQPIRK